MSLKDIQKYDRVLHTKGFKFAKTIHSRIEHLSDSGPGFDYYRQAGFDGECQELSMLVCLSAKATGMRNLALWNRQGDFTPTQRITSA